MAAQVVPLFRRLRPHYDWTPGELAQFYRVESALIQAGLQLETERGLTDEGDPWFVFCRADTSEVFIHFARTGGQYIAVGAALDQVIRGRDFPMLVQEMLTAQAWSIAQARSPKGRSNVFLHPSALLIALVGAAFFHSGEAKAATPGAAGSTAAGARKFVLPILVQSASGDDAAPLDAAQTSTILSSVLIALGELTPTPTVIADTAASVWADLVADPVAPPPALQALTEAAAATTQPAPTPTDLSAAQQSAFELLQLHASQSLSFSPSAPPISLAGGASGPSSAATPAPTETPNIHSDFAAALTGGAVALLQTATNDAAQVIQASDVLNYVSPQPNSAPITPPAVLSAPIKNGEHVVVLDPPAGGTHPVSPVAPPTDPHGAPNPPPGGTGELPVDSPIVSAAVAQFATEVSALDVSYSGREVILYDAALVHAVAPGTQLDSVTFNFADGSSISLVGTASELQSLHLPFPVG